jgi:hypothetical protein
VNAENFKWVEGMLAFIPLENDEWVPVRLTPPMVDTWNRNNVKDCLPAIDDPATMGCVISLISYQFEIKEYIDMLIETLEKPQETNVA